MWPIGRTPVASNDTPGPRTRCTLPLDRDDDRLATGRQAGEVVGQGPRDQDRDRPGHQDGQGVDANDRPPARDAPPLEPVGEGAEQERRDAGHQQCDGDPQQAE